MRNSLILYIGLYILYRPPVLNEQFTANLVPLRATSSESVPVMELYNMYNPEDINKSFATACTITNRKRRCI